MKRTLLFALIALLGLAQAQVVRNFTSRFSTNTQGDILLVGNTLMTCSTTGTNGSNCTNARNGGGSNNNSFTMVYVDQDSDPATFNSSSATLSLPAGATVLWAGLYWGAEAPTSAIPNPNTIRFRTPGSSTYTSITASQTDTCLRPDNRRQYQGFREVTALVQAAGPGIYWVADVPASSNATDRYAGWGLVVVYQHSSQPLRHLNVYDGYAAVTTVSPTSSTVSLVVSGFLTPATGPVTTRLGTIAYEGDLATSGDRLRLNSTDVSDPRNPANNFFNSTISDLGNHVTSKNPNYINQLGFDLDRIESTSLLGNNQTSATVTFLTTGDFYYPGVLTFAVNVFVPDLTTTFTKSVTDLNGGSVLPGDILEYTISFSNTGQDGATNVVLRDPIPAHTQYVPGTLQVTANAALAPTGSFTDASGDDIAEYSPSCPELSGSPPCVRFRLGSGANATQGGLILPGQGASVTFRVQVLPSAAGQTITNTAQTSYNSQTLGTAFSQDASVSANSPVPSPPTLSKTFTPPSIPTGGTSTLTITLTNPNNSSLGPATLTAPLVDTLPSGLVVAPAGLATTTCPGGSVSATPGGSTVTLQQGAQIPAGGSCTVSMNVTGSTPGSYTNTLPAGALQTDLGSNQAPASAVLSVTGVSLSGQVYHDQEPNGAKNSGEDWSGSPTVYVKLIQGSSVIAVQTVGPGTGNFSFTGVAPGSYTLIVDNNNNTGDTTPTPPPGWLFINPASGSRNVTVGSINVLGQDFGLFHGSMVEGQVFYDNAEGGGTANNALREASERGAATLVTATDGPSTRTASTDGNGFYRLYIPTSWGSVTLSHPLRPATGWNNGSTATLVGSWADANSPASTGAVISLGSAGSLAGSTLVRNFGVVRPSELRPDQSGQVTSPGTLTYAHLFQPGTLGSVSLTLSNTPGLSYQARLDANCNGTWDSGEVFTTLPLSFTVLPAWPRDPDSRLKACALEVRAQAPAGLPAGYADIALLKSSLTWTNNTPVIEERSLTDTTTVILAGQLQLSKQVRNVSQGTGFATSGQGRPGEVLEYRIQYQNIGSQPIFNVVVLDPIPFFSTLVQNAYGGTGEVELVCPDSTIVRPDLGAISNISLNLAAYCSLSSAPHPGGGSAPALLPGQSGFFVYRVQVN